MLKVVGRPASPRPAGLELARFGPRICLYIQFIGVHWRVPSGLVARKNVFGKGAGPAGLQAQHNPSSKLVICITFASGL